MLPWWFFFFPGAILLITAGIPLWSHLLVKWSEREKGAGPSQLR